MSDNDSFKDWIKTQLEDELKDIRFSESARAKVQSALADRVLADRVLADSLMRPSMEDMSTTQSTAEQSAYRTSASSVPRNSKSSWWSGYVSLPRTAVSFALAGFMLLIGVYFSLFFYVSSAQIAELNTRQKIVVPQDNIPFGALKVQISTLLTQGKGVGKP